MIDIRRKNENRNKFLVTLYKMSNGNPQQMVFTESITNEIGVDYENEGSLIGQYWQSKSCVTWSSFTYIYITQQGIIEAEQIMEKSYKEKAYLVLKKLYEDTRYNNSKLSSSELSESLSIPKDEIDDIFNDFEQRNWIWKIFKMGARINPEGVTAFNTWENAHNQSSSTNFRDVYNTNIYAPSNNQIGGSHNSLYVQMNLNPEFEKLIAPVLDLIRSSEMSQHDKDEFIQDIQTVNRLVTENPERAKAKFDYLGTALKVTDIGLKIMPYMPAISDFIQSKIS